MTAIWLLSTKGRPEACQQVLDACEATGMTSPGVVYVDEDDGSYRDLRLPNNWAIHREPLWGSLQASMQWCLRTYPHATRYGWLADDTLPRTNGWDRVLENAAGEWCLSYAKDLWLSEREHSLAALVHGDDLSSGLCWGSQLIRTVGWWALPRVTQAGIDTAWCAIVGSLGLNRYLPNVIVEHQNYRTGKRAKDDVDDWERDGADYIGRDIATRDAWAASADFRDVLERVAKLAHVDLTPFQYDRLRQRVRDSHANERWKPGSAAAKLVRILREIDLELDSLVADILYSQSNPEPAR